MFIEYDIIVIGGGHAGCEASVAAAKLGSRVLLISMNLNQFAQMSCNPSMGGIAKGQIVREIDAMGGMSGIITDKTTIQFRMLNRSKGPAMWSPRAQNDRMEFSSAWREEIENTQGLDLWQDIVNDIKVRNDKVVGVYTQMGIEINAKAVIITAGTFLNGKIHIGKINFEGGRIGEFSSKYLTESLKKYKIENERMKTGTPVRIDGRTVNFNKLIEQKGDENPSQFSFLKQNCEYKQISCWLAYTDEEVHDILKIGFNDSPLFQGRIKGIGPRYCPSIEDKIERFSDKKQHQLFLEPEGRNTIEYYLNGFSSSLPEEIQYKALKKIKGFENVKIFRPGYAIEYDYFPPVQLKTNLESKIIENLFFAGQVNGTTGYEEAAAQGLMAGINASRKINNLSPCILSRSQAYIGVLIDDLVTKGTDEPYRMFTSRAEYRILLRQDNADARLTPVSYELGLANKERFDKYNIKQQNIDEIIKYIESESVSPEQINSLLIAKGSPPVNQKTKMCNLILRPQLCIFDFKENIPLFQNFLTANPGITDEDIEEAEIMMKYKSYINKEKEIADKLSRLEDIELYNNFDYSKLNSLSFEAREKLCKIKPATIGQASRIPGVSPADISVLLVYLGR